MVLPFATQRRTFSCTTTVTAVVLMPILELVLYLVPLLKTIVWALHIMVAVAPVSREPWSIRSRTLTPPPIRGATRLQHPTLKKFAFRNLLITQLVKWYWMVQNVFHARSVATTQKSPLIAQMLVGEKGPESQTRSPLSLLVSNQSQMKQSVGFVLKRALHSIHLSTMYK